MNITASIHMHARLRPRAPAIISPAASLTFAQLDALIWRLAARFRAESLETGQVVMLDIADSVKHLIVALGLARIGVAHLANVRGGWFYPGDLGLLTDEGQVIYKGRGDDMMLYDGINIYPAEIEGILTAHEAVVEAAAFALQSEVHQDFPRNSAGKILKRDLPGLLKLTS